MKTTTLGRALALVSALAAAISAPSAQRRAAAVSSPAVDAQAALDPVATLQNIDAASFTTRDSLLDEVSRRIAASEKAMAAMENRAKLLDAGGRERFKADLAVARQRGEDLKHSLEAARKATARDWEHAQAMLADKYSLYDDEMELLNVVAPVMPPA